MDKLQATAARAVSGFLNEKGKKKNTKPSPKLQDSMKSSASRGNVVEICAHQCSYCPKAFSNPSFLIKHMIRRHSDHLLALHDQCYTHRNAQNKTFETSTAKSVESSLKPEINEMKQFLNQLKVEIVQMLQTADSRQKVKSKCSHVCDTDDEMPTKVKAYHQRKKDSHSTELSELRAMCGSSQETLRDLDKRYNLLLEAVQQDVQLKETLARKDAENVKIANELKMLRIEVASLKEKACNLERHLVSLKSSVSKEMQCQNEELEGKIQQLSKRQTTDVQHLCTHIEEQLNKVNCSVDKDVEDRFEQCLQNYLNKLPKPDKTRERKANLFPSFPSASVKKLKHHNVKNSSKCLPHLKRARGYTKHNSSAVINFSKQVEALINDKMQDIGILPGCQCLTLADLATKRTLVTNNAKYLQSKYKDFVTFRKKLEQSVQTKTQLLVTKQVHKEKHHSILPSGSGKRNLHKQVLFQNDEDSMSADPFSQAAAQSSFEFVVQNHDCNLSEAQETMEPTNSEEEPGQQDISMSAESVSSEDVELDPDTTSDCTNSSSGLIAEQKLNKKKEPSSEFVHRKPELEEELLDTCENIVDGDSHSSMFLKHSESGSSLQTLDSWDDDNDGVETNSQLKPHI